MHRYQENEQSDNLHTVMIPPEEVARLVARWLHVAKRLAHGGHIDRGPSDPARIGTPEDVAQAALFLASQEA